MHIKIYMLILAFTLSACSSLSPQKQQQKNTTGSELIGGSFSMTDQNGRNVTEKNFHGKYTLVFFGFTNCPTVCPLGLSTIGRAIYHLPDEYKDSIVPIFVTIDPENDTEKVIKKYIKSFSRKFVGLRGTIEDTDKMILNYRGYYKKIKEGDSYTMEHSDIIYLMDKQGRYVSHFSSSRGHKVITKKLLDYINL